MAEKRAFEKWNYKVVSGLIEAAVIIAVVYGGMRVTLAGLSADVSTLKHDSSEHTLDIGKIQTEIDVRFKYISKALDKIDRKLGG